MKMGCNFLIAQPIKTNLDKKFLILVEFLKSRNIVNLSPQTVCAFERHGESVGKSLLYSVSLALILFFISKMVIMRLLSLDYPGR